jgi:hypothetical protein
MSTDKSEELAEAALWLRKLMYREELGTFEQIQRKVCVVLDALEARPVDRDGLAKALYGEKIGVKVSDHTWAKVSRDTKAMFESAADAAIAYLGAQPGPVACEPLTATEIDAITDEWASAPFPDGDYKSIVQRENAGFRQLAEMAAEAQRLKRKHQEAQPAPTSEPKYLNMLTVSPATVRQLEYWSSARSGEVKYELADIVANLSLRLALDELAAKVLPLAKGEPAHGFGPYDGGGPRSCEPAPTTSAKTATPAPSIDYAQDLAWLQKVEDGIHGPTEAIRAHSLLGSIALMAEESSKLRAELETVTKEGTPLVMSATVVNRPEVDEVGVRIVTGAKRSGAELKIFITCRNGIQAGEFARVLTAARMPATSKDGE